MWGVKTLTSPGYLPFHRRAIAQIPSSSSSEVGTKPFRIPREEHFSHVAVTEFLLRVWTAVREWLLFKERRKKSLGEIKKRKPVEVSWNNSGFENGALKGQKKVRDDAETSECPTFEGTFYSTLV